MYWGWHRNTKVMANILVMKNFNLIINFVSAKQLLEPIKGLVSYLPAGQVSLSVLKI